MLTQFICTAFNNEYFVAKLYHKIDTNPKKKKQTKNMETIFFYYQLNFNCVRNETITLRKSQYLR